MIRHPDQIRRISPSKCVQLVENPPELSVQIHQVREIATSGMPPVALLGMLIFEINRRVGVNQPLRGDREWKRVRIDGTHVFCRRAVRAVRADVTDLRQEGLILRRFLYKCQRMLRDPRSLRDFFRKRQRIRLGCVFRKLRRGPVKRRFDRQDTIPQVNFVRTHRRQIPGWLAPGASPVPPHSALGIPFQPNRAIYRPAAPR